MFSSKMKKLIFGASIALQAMCSSAYAAANIKIGVAANFSNTLNAIISSFQNYYNGSGYTFTVTVDSTTNLKNAIIAGGTTGPYDLFLSADFAAPQALYTSYNSFVVGSPFPYAIGSLELYSGPVNTVNISAGLPSPLTTDFVIADPTKAPYGLAASQVLASSPWNITTIPSGHVFTRPNINSTYSAVQAGTYAYGFVAKSAICQYTGGSEHYISGTYHHEYLYNDASHPYNQIKQYGIEIALTRTTDQNTELTNFVNFLTGVGTSLGTAKIQQYCYILP
ncbi:substrate-binding domain-containing protein [Methylocapsa polymorpha]|uniref:Substrate-binding domain-containing protein n=1 Tax=Methylocapsa polymorpha TaxID=3080828 RepID=A0ABZ0HWW5_9HYPH|nr:substrate-binding domain-containing protein [Methylocapsa sp. RX1]